MNKSTKTRQEERRKTYFYPSHLQGIHLKKKKNICISEKDSIKDYKRVMNVKKKATYMHVLVKKIT